MVAQVRLDYDSLSDLELAARIAARDAEAVRLVTQRNNRRLFRAAWSILKNRDDAEDAIQSAYLRGFGAITDFAGKSSLTTWLTRIVINEALGRRRAEKRRRAHLDSNSVLFLDDYREKLMRGSTSQSSPEASVARAQIRQMLEDAIAKLPSTFRMVFILRDIEGLTVAEVAETLEIPPATVKTRHLRARRRLQSDLAPELRNALAGTFPFGGANCEELTERVVRAFMSGGVEPPGPAVHQGITEVALEAVVDSFYDRVRRDALIGPIFNSAIADWPEHLEKLQSFWSSVMLTSGRYKGRPLPAHIKHADAISPESFERWLTIWRETTNELLDPQSASALQKKAGRIAESLSLGIAFHRDRTAIPTATRVD